ncbi:MAG TPA: tRNA lysidine(34) synthetase TilS [Vicinamibacterales bacterium]|nr:tRNA lysidine(34) synthetase TilS [Vicinamibacterales bacterium]
MPLTGASLRALEGHSVAAAVSGGADSVALALWLRAHHHRTPQTVTFAGIIHVNHRLRGDESDRDEAFCRALAARLGVPIEVIEGRIADSSGRSPESAARAARYCAFADAAPRLGATRVATAHTADDQAETVLMRLLRGAGSRGVSGIRAERGLYVRPLLGCRRSMVRAWLKSQGEVCCEDSSNADRSITRNRVRHDLLPVIEQIAPGGIVALARAATLAADDETVLQELAVESAATLVLSADTGAARVDRVGLQVLPPAIARRVLRLVFEKVAPNASWRADHFEAVLKLAARRAGGGSLDLPGVRIERVSNELRVRAGMPARVAPYVYTLTSDGEVRVSEAGLGISASVRNGASDATDGAYVIAVPSTAFPLTVRNRRPGDRVAMISGTRKVQDLMVDAKIPRSERAIVPLVVAADGQILWVIGHHGTRVPVAGTDVVNMVTLKARRLETT